MAAAGARRREEKDRIRTARTRDQCDRRSGQQSFRYRLHCTGQQNWRGPIQSGADPASALDKIKAEGIFYRNALELLPGMYQVRFVVRDNLSGRIGSVSAPL